MQRRNNHAVSFRLCRTALEGSTVIALDLTRRAVCVALVAGLLLAVPLLLAAVLARLAWLSWNDRDRAAVVGGLRRALDAASRLPGWLWSILAVLDRASVWAALVVVGVIEAVREEIDRARAPRRRPMTAAEVAAWDRLLGYERQAA